MRGTVAAILVLLASSLSLACDPGHNVTFVNRTGSPITLTLDGVREVTIAPDDKKTLTFLEHNFKSKRTFAAMSETNGQLLYRVAVNWNDLTQLRWTVERVNQPPS